jgi:hypothetical protein
MKCFHFPDESVMLFMCPRSRLPIEKRWPKKLKIQRRVVPDTDLPIAHTVHHRNYNFNIISKQAVCLHCFHSNPNWQIAPCHELSRHRMRAVAILRALKLLVVGGYCYNGLRDMDWRCRERETQAM